MENSHGFLGISKFAWVWIGIIAGLGMGLLILALILAAFGIDVPGVA